MKRRLALLALGLALAAAPALADDTPAPPAPPAQPAQPAPPAPAAADEAKAPAEAEWAADFDKAVEKAKAEKKDLLVDFTGSDWCIWCKRLHEEVFAQPEFVEAAPKSFVLVSLDFPHKPELQAKVPNPARNKELAEKHGVEGFPTVLLMTPEGDVYGRTGYEQGGAAKWMESVNALREKGRPALVAAIALAAEFAAAQGEARAPLAEKAVALLEDAAEGSAWTGKVVPAALASMEIDPDDAKGLQVRAIRALYKVGAADDAVIAATRKLDPKNEKGLLEKAVLTQVTRVHDKPTVEAAAKAIEELDAFPIQDAETKQVLYANVAFWNLQLFDDREKARFWGEKLKAVADPKNPQFARLLEAIFAKKEAEEMNEGPEKGEGPEDGGDEKGDDGKGADPAK